MSDETTIPTWVAHPGAVVLHRWGSAAGEWAVLTCEDATDGERICVVRGERVNAPGSEA